MDKEISFKANINKKISETKVINDYIQKGYLVRKIAKQLVNWKSSSHYVYFNEKGFEDIMENYNGEKEKLLKIMKENVKGIPDLLCEKDGEIIFVEVKSNNSSLSNDQERVIQLLKKEGYKVIIKRVKVRFSAEYIE